MFCSHCRKYCPVEEFTSYEGGRVYKNCEHCRARVKAKWQRDNSKSGARARMAESMGGDFRSGELLKKAFFDMA
jgi:hypothetical protein